MLLFSNSLHYIFAQLTTIICLLKLYEYALGIPLELNNITTIHDSYINGLTIMLVSAHFAIYKYYLLLRQSLENNSKPLTIKYIRTSIIVSIGFEAIQIVSKYGVQTSMGQIDYVKNAKLIKLTEISYIASIFEIGQCLAEIAYMLFEFNTKTKKESITIIEIIKPKFLD